MGNELTYHPWHMAHREHAWLGLAALRAVQDCRCPHPRPLSCTGALWNQRWYYLWIWNLGAHKMESIWTLYKSLSTCQCTHCWLSHVDELAVVFVGEAWGKHAGKIKCAWDLWKESMCVETQKYVYIWPFHSNTKSQWKVFQIDQLYFSRMALNIRLWEERLVIFFHLIIYICGFQPLTPGYTWHNCHNPLEISRLEKKIF